MADIFDRKRLAPLKDTVAIVGVGETDYGADYRGAGGRAMAKGAARYDSYTLASRALKRALDDAGLNKEDIDGLCTGATLSGERASELWGLNPRWSGSGDAAQGIIEATMAIHCGLCTTVALVYGNAQRSMDTAYGGSRVTGGGITPISTTRPGASPRRARCTRCFSSAISCSMAPPKSNWGHRGGVSQARLPES